MVREYTTLSFEEYFWRGVDLDGKVVLDAGTGFGVTTCEIAKRMSRQKHRGKIISVDIDPEAFEHARKMLQMQGWIDLLKLKAPKELLCLVEFVKADLSNMPEIKSESIDVMRLAGFKECRYAIFNGEKIPQRRMKHFEERAKELVSKLENLKIKDAFIDEVKRVKEMFNKQGGSFPSDIFYTPKSD